MSIDAEGSTRSSVADATALLATDPAGAESILKQILSRPAGNSRRDTALFAAHRLLHQVPRTRNCYARRRLRSPSLESSTGTRSERARGREGDGADAMRPQGRSCSRRCRALFKASHGAPRQSQDGQTQCVSLAPPPRTPAEHPAAQSEPSSTSSPRSLGAVQFRLR